MLNGDTFNALPVAWFRIGVGIAVVMVSIENLMTLLDVAGGRVSMPLLPWIPPLDNAAAIALGALGIAAGIALGVGLYARASAAFACIAMVTVQFVEQQAYSSHHVLAVLLCAYLAFVGSDARLSLRPRRTHVETVARLPILMVLTQISVVYLFTAISKLNPSFLSGDVIRNSVTVPLPPEIYPALAWASVALEALLVVALWIPQSASIAVILGTLFHITIATILRDPFGLWAFTILMISTYPLFIVRAGVSTRWIALYHRARTYELTRAKK